MVINFPPQKTRTKRMECIHPQFIRFRPYQMMDTFTHFLCRFICKSDSKDILRPYSLLQHISNAAG